MTRAQRKAENRAAWEARKAKIAEVYAYMVETLGGYCGASCTDHELGCGAKTDLQLHHNDGKSWEANKVGPLKRIKRLVEDFIFDRLGVLCRECNQTDGGRKTAYYRQRRKEQRAPF
jgi:hypothetical protein